MFIIFICHFCIWAEWLETKALPQRYIVILLCLYKCLSSFRLIDDVIIFLFYFIFSQMLSFLWFLLFSVILSWTLYRWKFCLNFFRMGELHLTFLCLSCSWFPFWYHFLFFEMFSSLWVCSILTDLRSWSWPIWQPSCFLFLLCAACAMLRIR